MIHNISRGKPLLLIGLSAATAVSFAAPTHAQMIVNGDFNTFVPSNGTGGGWTSIHIDGAGGHRTSGGNPDNFFILNDNGNAATDSTISQVVSGLSVGSTYNLSGDYRTVYVGQNTGATQSFGAAVDGAFVFESPGVPNTAFNHFSVDFVAAAASVTISLAAERNGTDNDFGVDNIALTFVSPALTPEPGAMALLASMGFMGAGFLSRRKRMCR